MTIIKRNRDDTTTDLIRAIERLCVLLKNQDDDEAIADLKAASEILCQKNTDPNSKKKAIALIIDAFEGDHELIAYTHQRNTEHWTEVEELSQASSRVISLARRMQRSM